MTVLALAACERPGPPSDITALLRAQGFTYLDEPEVTISPICSMRIGPARYDFYWYKWQQQQAPGALHAAHRLIQIRDGRTYDGQYGSTQPNDRPTCKPDSHDLVFVAQLTDAHQTGSAPQVTVRVAQDGLPLRLFVNGEAYTRER